MPNSKRNAQDAQVPPHSIEAEQAVLGACLIAPEALADVAEIIQPHDFFTLRHEYIFDALLNLSAQGKPCDILALKELLAERGQLELVDGMSYLITLTTVTPTSAHATLYAELVQRTARRRRLLIAADKIQALATEPNKTIDEVDAEVSAIMAEAQAPPSNRREAITYADALAKTFDIIEKRQMGEALGIPTGLIDIDRIIHGFPYGALTTIAGRPGMGKSVFLQNALIRVAQKGYKAALFTFEMNVTQTMERLLSVQSGIDAKRIRQGTLDSDEMIKVFETGKNPLPVWLDDSANTSLEYVVRKIHRLVRIESVRIVFIDYVQLMGASGFKSDNRVQEMTHITKTLKNVALTLNIPIVIAAQLSRSVEQRSDKRPTLSDLRESGSIEQDSDIVAFLYRDDYYNEQSERPNQTDVIIAKHRYGETGVATLYFNAHITRFDNLKKTTIDLNANF